MFIARKWAVSATASLLAVTISCAEPTSGASGAPEVIPQPVALTLAGPTLLQCPGGSELTGTAQVGPLGGVLQAGGVAIEIPAGAVPVLTQFTVKVPTSSYMEISVSAAGVLHYIFERPVSVTIDYSRCPSAAIEKGPLSVYYIDEDTKALLRNMGGVDDRAAKKITFTTDHFSGYAIAN